MATKVHRIDSLPDDAPRGDRGTPADAQPRTVRALDKVLAVQRPVVLAHLRSIRLRNPNATPTEIVRVLERRYLAAVTTGGAAVGATAVVPGITTAATLALSGVETVGFLESTALFAQSVAEVHGIAVSDPERARALVLTLMLGTEGTDLLAQLAGQARGTSSSRPAYWGELVTKTLPRAAMGPIVDRLKSTFVKQFTARAGASWVGKALPFGIGAAVGGAGNHILARRVITASHRAFGLAPLRMPADLEPIPGTLPLESLAVQGIRRAGGAVAGFAERTGTAVVTAGRKATHAVTARRGAASVTPAEED